MRVVFASAHPKYSFDEREVQRVARGVAHHENSELAFVSIVAVGHGWMRRLNRHFLRRDETTDVLAFSLGEKPGMEGEIYINVELARRQARDFEVSLSNEVTRLLIHGLLHLIGYDDRTVSERKRMKAREEKLVRLFDRGMILRS